MSIFPDDYGKNITAITTTTKSTTQELLKEYAIDDDGEFLLDENNQFTIVESLEAVKVMCWIKLKIQRNRYLSYMDEGNNVKNLLGKDLTYINKNIHQILIEALVDNIYVTSIENIEVTKNEDKYTVEFTIISIYGSYTTQESW